jgi:hypothetical protein
LKVAWPSGPQTRGTLPVAGETAPGARVRVGGNLLAADEQGRFQTDLHLPDGTHHVAVRAVDVAGHVSDEESPAIVIDTRTDFKVLKPKWK